MDLKRLNDYDETEQAGPLTIMHMWKNLVSAEFERLSFTKLALVVFNHFKSRFLTKSLLY